MYNPWSITNFLDDGKLDVYWANTSSNGLVGKLMRTGRPEIKRLFEKLMKGETIQVPVDEQIIYNQLDTNPAAIWSLLLASGIPEGYTNNILPGAGYLPGGADLYAGADKL